VARIRGRGPGRLPGLRGSVIHRRGGESLLWEEGLVEAEFVEEEGPNEREGFAKEWRVFRGSASRFDGGARERQRKIQDSGEGDVFVRRQDAL